MQLRPRPHFKNYKGGIKRRKEKKGWMKTGGGGSQSREFIVSIAISGDLGYGAIGRKPEDG